MIAVVGLKGNIFVSRLVHFVSLEKIFLYKVAFLYFSDVHRFKMNENVAFLK